MALRFSNDGARFFTVDSDLSGFCLYLSPPCGFNSIVNCCLEIS